MKITIKSKQLDLTSDLRNYIENKFSKFYRFVKRLDPKSSFPKVLPNLIVEVEKITKHHRKGDVFKAEVIMHLPGKKLFAKSVGENLLKEIVNVRNELEREFRKYKTRIVDMPRRKYQKMKKK